jgi:choline dehydrogenase-like flavoprotein
MRYETDVCIVGGGISAAMLAQKLSELKPSLNVIVVEAGSRLFDLENRAAYRQRMLDYQQVLGRRSDPAFALRSCHGLADDLDRPGALLLRSGAAARRLG